MSGLHLLLRGGQLVAGIVLFAVGCILTGAWVQLAVPEPALPGNALPTPWSAERVGADLEDGRERSVSIREAGGRIFIVWTLTSIASDPVVSSVARGETVDTGILLAGEVALVNVTHEGPSTSLYAGTTAPTTTTLADGRMKVQVSASTAMGAGDTTLDLQSSCRAGSDDRACSIQVEVTTTTTLITGVRPLAVVTFSTERDRSFDVSRRGPKSLSLTYTGATSIVVSEDLPKGGPPGSRLISLPPSLRWTWAATLLVAPAAFLVARRRQWIDSADSHRPGRQLVTLKATVTAFVAVVVMSNYYSIEEWLYAHLADSLGTFPDLMFWAQEAGSSTRSLDAAVAAAASQVPLVALLGAGLAPVLLRSSASTRGGAAAAAWVPLVTVLVVGGVALGALRDELEFEWMTRAASAVLVGGGTVLAGTGAVVVVRVGTGRGASRPASTGAAAAASICALVLQLLSATRPELQAAAGWASVLLMALFLASLFVGSIDSLSRRRVRRWSWGVLWAGAAVIAFPQQGLGGENDFPTTSDTFFALGNTRGVVQLAIIAAVLACLRLVPDAASISRIPRPAFLALALVMVLRPSVLWGPLPLSAIVGALVLAAVDRGSAGSTDVVADPFRVREVAQLSARRRTVLELQQTMGKAVAAGETTWEAGQRKIQDLRSSSMGGRTDLQYSVERRAVFALGPFSAWKRALLGSVVAAVAGLPGFIQALETLNGETQSPTPLLSAAATLALAVRYPLYGFFFGFFLARFAGSTSLGKSFSLFWVLGASETMAILLPGVDDGAEVVASTVSWIAQIFFICFALGLTFDYALLRSAGLGLGELRDVHHTSRLLAYASVLTVSLGTALTAALTSSAVTLLLGSGTGG